MLADTGQQLNVLYSVEGWYIGYYCKTSFAWVRVSRYYQLSSEAFEALSALGIVEGEYRGADAAYTLAKIMTDRQKVFEDANRRLKEEEYFGRKYVEWLESKPTILSKPGCCS